jgi:hypothetical protein
MKTYSHDYLFDASLNDPYRKIYTIRDMERKAEEEDIAPEIRTFRFHAIKRAIEENKKTWLDKFLDKIYES